MRTGSITAMVSLAMATAGSAFGDFLFSEDFESGLDAWTGKSGGAHHGVAAVDPLDPANMALTFSAMNAAGDVFMADPMTFEHGETYVLSFDYLGLPDQGMNPNVGTNGFLGLSLGLPDSHVWLYATQTTSGAADVLIDDGAWHHYEYEISAPSSWTSGTGSAEVRLMLEDFYGSGGVAGDAYFDNVSVRTVPGPGAMALLGLAGVVARRGRRR